ncbi:hypothetical protein [Erythrobacter rubeus]|uniref:Uncharacterized protein n=1 Tax=Erythrobacter rubeus TaxID=2760803 RepID=A0ABR8KSB8_9SPHN|nr:hypothetical protein [Erythrobacter rubeus]MBD2842240.1 hypothetical protein [Erythrobacter rubeus]
MIDEQWTEEPTGRGFSYMVRAASEDSTSFIRKGFQYPLEGYVEARAARDGVFALRPELFAPGLYGYVHGWGSYHTPFSMYYAAGSMIWQLMIVRDCEVIYNRRDGDRSCRVPRAWIKYTAEAKDLLDFLREEGTPYARLVADNFEREYKYWPSVFDRVLEKRTACA